MSDLKNFIFAQDPRARAEQAEAELDAARATIAGLQRSLAQAQERERTTADVYQQQQTSYRELEGLYTAMTERAQGAEADNAALLAIARRSHEPKTWLGLQEIADALKAEHPGAALLAEIAELRRMAAWSCESCGARFALDVPPGSMEGVRRCTKCVEVEQAGIAIADLRGALNTALAELEATRPRLHQTARQLGRCDMAFEIILGLTTAEKCHKTARRMRDELKAST